MLQCAHCGAVILLGGRQEGTLRFCNDTCWKKGAAEIPTQPPQFRLTMQFRIGLVTLTLGTGPLVAIGLLDRKSNPVGLGILAMLTFWPGVLLMLGGLLSSFFRYRAARKRFQNQTTKSAQPNSPPVRKS